MMPYLHKKNRYVAASVVMDTDTQNNCRNPMAHALRINEELPSLFNTNLLNLVIIVYPLS